MPLWSCLGSSADVQTESCPSCRAIPPNSTRTAGGVFLGQGEWQLVAYAVGKVYPKSVNWCDDCESFWVEWADADGDTDSVSS